MADEVRIDQIPVTSVLENAKILGVNAEGGTNLFLLQAILALIATTGIVDPVEPGSQLPKPSGKASMFPLKAGVYTQPSGGGSAVTALDKKFNIAYFNGTRWDITSYDIEADLSSYAPIKGVVNSLERIYLDSTTMDLGALISGRYTSITATDTNSSYRLTDFISVSPEWILSINRATTNNARSIEFDEFKNPIKIMNWTLNTDYALHPNTRFVRFSDLTGNMTSLVVTVKGAISSAFRSFALKTVSNDEVLIPKADNVFNWRTLMYNTQLASTGNIVANAATIVTTPLIRINETGVYVACNVINTINPVRFASYTESGVFIEGSYASIAAADTKIDQMLGRYAEYTVPANAFYIRYSFDFRPENTQQQLENMFVGPRRAWRSLINNRSFSPLLTTSQIRALIKAERVIDNDLSTMTVLKLGDSITANLAAAGSWNIWFNGTLRPANIYSPASGGATLTSTEALFGAEYINGGNTFLKQCELAYRNIANGTYKTPDIIIIMGGTNDFDLSRYSLPSEIGTMDYDEYMEGQFFTVAPNFNTLKPLAEVNRGKIAGALRYIVERLGTIAPNAIFWICTPIQSTLHNRLSQKRVVRDILWAANWLNIPVIDQWNKAGMTPLWDFGTDRRFLGDRVHPFTDTGQTRGSDVMGRFVSNEATQLFIPNA